VTEVRVSIRVRPGASRTLVAGAYGAGADARLVVAVTSRAVDGAATEAALRAIAEAVGIRRSDVELVSGHTSRNKVVALRGNPSELKQAIERLMASR